MELTEVLTIKNIIMETLTIIYILKIIGSIVLIILAASICFSSVYYFFKCYNQEKTMDMLYEEISEQNKQYKELLKINEQIEEKNIELEVKILELESQISKLQYINNGLEKSIGYFSIEKVKANCLIEDLTCKLNSSRAKISVLSKNINIPENDLVEFLLKHKKKVSKIYVQEGEFPSITNFCLYCEFPISEEKTFCNKSCQEQYRKNNYKPAPNPTSYEKM